MKLRNITYDSHNILGNLSIDFVNPDTGMAYDTILLAGENGSGKTSVLKSITTFLKGGVIKGKFQKIGYEINTDKYEMTPADNDFNWYFLRSKNGGDATVFDYSGSTHRDRMLADTEDPRNFGLVLSKPRADFKTVDIKNVSSSDIDSGKQDDDSQDEYTSLKQLIIDVDTLDAEEFRKRHAAGDTVPYREFLRESRIARFSGAFDNFFESLKFKGIQTANGVKEIYFTKNGHDIPIDSLSTGEKQIVFRGIYLLRNLKNLQGGVVLIDEPELSLHPRWQQKILKYYQTLFSDPVTGVQSVQLIVATHAERILTAAFEDRTLRDINNGVIVLSDNNGMINAETVTSPGVLPVVTAAETNYLAYKIPTVDYHIELFAALQHRYGDTNVSDTDNRIVTEPSYNPAQHAKTWRFLNPDGTLRREYHSLPVFVRNAIDHPDPTGVQTYTAEELQRSIEFMRTLL